MLSQNEFEALNAALKSADVNQLEALAKSAIGNYPQEGSAYYFLAEAFYLQQQLDKAAICLAKAIELEPENAAYLLRLAKQKEIEGAKDDANLLYRKAYNLDPDNVEVLVGIIKYYLFEEQDIEDAQQHLDEALKQHADNAMLCYLQAQALKLQDEVEEALEWVDKSLELGLSEEAFVCKINLLIQLGSTDAVVETQQQLIRYLGDAAGTYKLNFASYLISIEQFSKAIELLNELLQESNSAHIQNLLALAHMGDGQYQQACAIYSSMIEHEPKLARLYISRAEAYQADAAYDLALKDYVKALTLMEGEERLLINEKLGQMYYDKKTYDLAIDQFKALTKVDWYAKTGYFLLGKAHYAANQKKEAFEALSKAAKLRNIAAIQFLNSHFSKQMQQLKTRVLDKFKGEFSKNSQSPILQKIYGKLCRIDVYKNKFDKNIPKEMLEAVRNALSDTFYVFTAQGIFCYNNIDKQGYSTTFRIVEEDEEDVLIEVFELNKTGTSYQMNISLEGNQLLIEPQKLKATTMVMKCIDSEKLSNADRKMVSKHSNKEDFAFLGKEAADLVASIFG